MFSGKAKRDLRQRLKRCPRRGEKTRLCRRELLPEERKEGVRLLAEQGPLVVGTGAPNTEMAADYAHHAKEAGAAGLMIIGVGIFPFLGAEFTPTLQEGTMVLRLTMAPSISLNESKRITLLVEKRLMTVPEVTGVVTRIGRGEVGAHTDPVNSAEMYVLLKEKETWRTATTQSELEDVIRDHLGEIPGVLTNFTQPIAMTIDELLEKFKDSKLKFKMTRPHKMTAIVVLSAPFLGGLRH